MDDIMYTKNKTIVFSIENSPANATDNDYNIVFGMLRGIGIPVREAVGCCKGKQERTFICPLVMQYHFEFVLDLAREYMQESILFVSEKQTAILYYLQTGKLDNIGKWTNVSRDAALKQDAYTFDHTSNNFFVAV